MNYENKVDKQTGDFESLFEKREAHFLHFVKQVQFIEEALKACILYKINKIHNVLNDNNLKYKITNSENIMSLSLSKLIKLFEKTYEEKELVENLINLNNQRDKIVHKEFLEDISDDNHNLKRIYGIHNSIKLAEKCYLRLGGIMSDFKDEIL